MSQSSPINGRLFRRATRHDLWVLIATVLAIATMKLLDIGRVWPEGEPSSFLKVIGCGLCFGLFLRLASAVPAWRAAVRWGSRSRRVLGWARPVRAWSRLLQLLVVAAAPLGVIAIAYAIVTPARFKDLEFPIELLAFCFQIAALVMILHRRQVTTGSWRTPQPPLAIGGDHG